MVAVAYRRWSFTRGSNCKIWENFYWENFGVLDRRSFIGGGHLREVVAHEVVAYKRWSHMRWSLTRGGRTWGGQLYNSDPEKFYLCLPNSCSDYFPAFLLMVTYSPQTWEVHTAPENCNRATLNELSSMLWGLYGFQSFFSFESVIAFRNSWIKNKVCDRTTEQHMYKTHSWDNSWVASVTPIFALWIARKQEQ